jgi:hypothetical protein
MAGRRRSAADAIGELAFMRSAAGDAKPSDEAHGDDSREEPAEAGFDLDSLLRGDPEGSRPPLALAAPGEPAEEGPGEDGPAADEDGARGEEAAGSRELAAPRRRPRRAVARNDQRKEVHVSLELDARARSLCRRYRVPGERALSTSALLSGYVRALDALGLDLDLSGITPVEEDQVEGRVLDALRVWSQRETGNA